MLARKRRLEQITNALEWGNTAWRSMMRRLPRGSIIRVMRLVLLPLIVGIPSAARAELTYNKDIKRLMQAKCMNCHSSSGVAPFSMETYSSTRPWAESIRYTVHNRIMPPWNGAHDQEFSDPEQGITNDRSLTQEQIDLLVRWVDEGSLEGDPAEAPPNPPAPTGWALGQPDIILSMQHPYKVTGGDGGNIQRWFVIPNDSPSELVVSGLEIRPSNLRVAHHMILYLDVNNSGLNDQNTYGSELTGWDFYDYSDWTDLPVAAWASRGDLQPYNPKAVVRIPPGADLTLQTHYRDDGFAPGEEDFDQTQIGLRLEESGSPQTLHLGGGEWLDFSIPPNAIDYPITRSWQLSRDIHLWAVNPHMHYHGASFEATALLPDSTTVRIINLDRWDFNWHNYYNYRKPVALPAGTEVTVNATFNNFSEDTVISGPASYEEMLTLVMAYTKDSEGVQTVPFDIVPPHIIRERWSANGQSLILDFSEPIQQPRYPYDVQIRSGGGLLQPVAEFFDGITYQLTFNPADLQPPITGFAWGYFGVKDMAGNYLDVNGNGVAGEYADRLTLIGPFSAAHHWADYE